MLPWLGLSFFRRHSSSVRRPGLVAIVMGGSTLLALVLGGCANPVPPSGGPQDETPPAVVQTQPERDTVNVSTDVRRLHIEFSEYVERSSLPQALSVTPTFEQQPTFSWSGQSVEIEFPASLRDSTTYLFTLDTDLTDAHGVSLDEPITVAFSTGPQINRGQLQGRVVGGHRGTPQEQVDVYAYALPGENAGPPQPLPDAPSYRTQTGSDGRFEFDYLSEQPYYVIALQDNNRNRQPDVLEPYAVPPKAALQVDSTAAEVSVPWLLTQADTIAPELQRVQALSRERLRVSFSEPVQFGTRAPEAWAPQDTVAGTRVDVQSVYADPDRADAAIVRTAAMEEREYRLPLERGVVTDTLGRALPADTARFQVPDRADTTQTRLRGFFPQSHSPDSTGAYPLLPDGRFGVRFNQAPGQSTLQRVLSVEDTTGQPRGFTLETDDGIAYEISFDPPLDPGEFADVEVDGGRLAGPDSTYRRRVRRVTSRALGELEGQVVLADTSLQSSAQEAPSTSLRLPSPFTESLEDLLIASYWEGESSEPQSGRIDRQRAGGKSPVVVELTGESVTLPFESRRLTTAVDSTFLFERLPEGQYHFRAFLDRNENERWDGGRLQPYRPAEPITWTRQPVEARPRWTTELANPLRIPVLRPTTGSPEAPSEAVDPGAGENR